MKLAIFLLGAFALSAQPLTKINETGYAKMIASNKGKVLLVDFWATWCVPCRKEMPELVKLEAKLKAKGLTLVTISADDLDNEQGNWPLANQQMYAALRFKSYDVKFVFGEGVHSNVHGGAILPDSLRWLWRP